MFSIQIKQAAAAKKSGMLVRSWPDRMERMQQQYAYMGAKHMMDFIKKRIPKGSAYKGYREGLEVVKVRGTRPGEYSYAIQVDQGNRFVQKLQVHRSLIYVKQGNKRGKRSEAIALLEKYNPWTFESLPFKPTPAEAKLVSRKARANDVLKITRQRQQQRQKWAPLLQRLGIKTPGKAAALKIPRTMQVLPDVTLDALKMEFGLGGMKAKPAWRLGFRNLKKVGFPSFLKDRRFFGNPLTKPAYNAWKKWPPNTKHKISIGKAKAFGGFQKKVAIR